MSGFILSIWHKAHQCDALCAPPGKSTLLGSQIVFRCHPLGGCLSPSLFFLRFEESLTFRNKLVGRNTSAPTQMFVLKLNYDGDTRRATFLNESKPDYVFLEKVRQSPCPKIKNVALGGTLTCVDVSSVRVLTSLYQHIREVFADSLQTDRNFKLKYLDDEGDAISVSCEHDLREAFLFCQSAGRSSLRMNILPIDKPVAETNDGEGTDKARSEEWSARVQTLRGKFK